MLQNWRKSWLWWVLFVCIIFFYERSASLLSASVVQKLILYPEYANCSFKKVVKLESSKSYRLPSYGLCTNITSFKYERTAAISFVLKKKAHRINKSHILLAGIMKNLWIASAVLCGVEGDIAMLLDCMGCVCTLTALATLFVEPQQGIAATPFATPHATGVLQDIWNMWVSRGSMLPVYLHFIKPWSPGVEESVDNKIGNTDT